MLVKLYPNPTSGTLTLTFNQLPERPYRITFTDLYGRTVYHTSVTQIEQTLDLSALAPGVYAYTLYSPDGSIFRQGRIARR